MILFLCVAALLAMHGAALAGERPEEAATSFYAACQKLRTAGLSGGSPTAKRCAGWRPA